MRHQEKQLSNSNNTYLKVKRMLDIILGLASFIFFFLVMLVVGVMVLIFNKRPIFFLQQRTGQFNQEFTIIKFRTMEKCDDSKVHQYKWDGQVPEDFVFKTPDSVQVTKLGAILRKYSLDELPQIINVIKGDMSFVGPRPEIMNITKFYNEAQKRRLVVKPGITGYAQIKGRSDINYGRKIHYDLYYVNHISFFFDFKIICKTILQVIRGKGAY
ncbi:sugar transferase [Bacillus thuringiensis]|uniref:sugar transferase n=1 Tax=Bacillus thuringiensis TaxID=1428 RepID=UPI001EE8AF94|nr:sugar transferase [Bacillus thuringiensis]MDZ3952358.1 sugar transferase [Bacillus thuringiensis]